MGQSTQQNCGEPCGEPYGEPSCSNEHKDVETNISQTTFEGCGQAVGIQSLMLN